VSAGRPALGERVSLDALTFGVHFMYDVVSRLVAQ